MTWLSLLSLVTLGVLAQPMASAKSILYIGDSHSYLPSVGRPNGAERFGSALLSSLKSEHHSAHYYAACGASAQTWAAGPTTTCGATRVVPGGTNESRVQGRFEGLAALNTTGAFDTVVINLGDNLFNWRRDGGKSHASIQSSDVVISQVRRLLSAVRQNQDCVWIGPTYHREGSLYSKSNQAVDHMYRALSEGLAGRCRLIDSRSYFSTTSPSDGLHFTDPESARWGALVADELKKLWAAPPRAGTTTVPASR